MARTAHHASPARRRGAEEWLPGQPWQSVVLYDLRYGSPGPPRLIRRAVNVYSLPRHHQDRTVAHWAAQEERRARQRLRSRAGVLLRLVNSPAGALDLDAADAVDIPPARHRHSGVWVA
ncbi:hypothetical protein AQF52_4570 [Streptomyces venezuelae]|uniref:hypothetical protein n=1 Tax=Streptomyces gardneri TaxID=66892 RepID=UPI0006BCD130|nr:hypothetical protein [Streptomyces gardneri]ALO10164.1 hypothetical protein AQF52_4570 [Streptomyces venezuelae]QPK47192.1 hypothetical protein H4W23_22925 [Streptomyces gardneri]WRK38614.1 hypothetical protein U0M97_23025 [Streptomyces venezuelae]CUM39386.1 hypothetical protein BN2537_7737 [Streptomyces venezuelae]